jgi:hypothetical protein
MNIVLAVALVPGGFAAVAAHTDELGHELWVFPDDHTNPVSTNGKHCGPKGDCRRSSLMPVQSHAGQRHFLAARTRCRVPGYSGTTVMIYGTFKQAFQRRSP